MDNEKISLRNTIFTNICLVVIIAFVYVMALTPFVSLFSKGPMLKGNTGEENVALQIAVNDSTDLEGYMDKLDGLGVSATFFFCEQCHRDNDVLMGQVLGKGHGIGYYVYEDCKGQQKDLYIGGGYSIPVMNYQENNVEKQVCPSINVTKLKSVDNWQELLGENIIQDMFIYINADNNFGDFEKIVQIVLNKGYTILKVNEML